MVMLRTDHWKLVHFGRNFPPQLFDLQDDPQELVDLGGDPGKNAIRDELYERLFEWMRARRNRIAMTDEAVDKRPSPSQAGGVTIGVW